MLRFVAVKVNIPDALVMPGLLTGLGGVVGASHPKATPGVDCALRVAVVALHNKL